VCSIMLRQSIKIKNNKKLFSRRNVRVVESSCFSSKAGMNKLRLDPSPRRRDRSFIHFDRITSLVPDFLKYFIRKVYFSTARRAYILNRMWEFPFLNLARPHQSSQQNILRFFFVFLAIMLTIENG